MELTQEDVIYILKLIMEAPVGRFSLQTDDLKLEITKGPTGYSSGDQPPGKHEPTGTSPVLEPASPLTTIIPVEREPAISVAEGLQAIKAPILGIFYQRPEPTAAPYVEVGSTVDEDTTVALIEVMKCFNPVKAGVKGRIVKICVENGGFVEYDQELFLVQPE
jgi:acetyl-CoA carboxylase biotin carboxyl carrier protein